jgi:hypothetical protein
MWARGEVVRSGMTKSSPRASAARLRVIRESCFMIWP